MQDDRKVDALLRLHCNLDPSQLGDEERLKLWHDYLFYRQQERNLLLGVMRQVMTEAFSKTPS